MTYQSVARLLRNVIMLLAAALPSAQKTSDWRFNQPGRAGIRIERFLVRQREARS